MAIDVSYDGAVATIRLARPDKLNALTLKMYEDLGRAFADVKRDDRVHVVVLAGTGERAFCVGADLNESIPALSAGRFDISAWDPAHLKTGSFYKPVISAVCTIRLVKGIGAECPVARDHVAFAFVAARYSSTVSVKPSVQSVCQCTVIVVTGSRCHVRYRATGRGGGGSTTGVAGAESFAAGVGV